MSNNSGNISNRTKELSDSLSAILANLGLSAEIFMRADLCGEWAIDTSGHRKMAFHLIEEGRGWLHTNDSSSPRLLSGGDLVVFPHDAQHYIASGPEQPAEAQVMQFTDNLEGEITSLLCGFFEFRNRNAYPLLDELPEVIVLKLMEHGIHNESYFLLQLLIAELKQDQPGRGAALNQLAYFLFIIVLRSQIRAGIGEGLLVALADKQIGRALNLIHLKYQDEWTVDKLARQIGMSRTKFSVQFTNLVGKSPVRYLTEWRMQEAAKLLQTTSASMADIANQVGYNSEMAFRKAFRNIIGETPGKVRRRGLSG